MFGFSMYFLVYFCLLCFNEYLNFRIFVYDFWFVWFIWCFWGFYYLVFRGVILFDRKGVFGLGISVFFSEGGEV